MEIYDGIKIYDEQSVKSFKPWLKSSRGSIGRDILKKMYEFKLDLMDIKNESASACEAAQSADSSIDSVSSDIDNIDTQISNIESACDDIASTVDDISHTIDENNSKILEYAEWYKNEVLAVKELLKKRNTDEILELDKKVTKSIKRMNFEILLIVITCALVLFLLTR